MKTVLVPGAPWPDPNEKRVVPKKQIETLPKQFVWQSESVDYFAETHNELLQPKKGRGNPNAAKNFEKFNLRSL
jgi:hypothetical protein